MIITKIWKRKSLWYGKITIEGETHALFIFPTFHGVLSCLQPALEALGEATKES